MELIKEALNKARTGGGGNRDGRALRLEPSVSAASEFWSLPRALLDVKHLEQQRIVSYAMTDPSHAAFNLLRTKVGKAMKDNGWKKPRRSIADERLRKDNGFNQSRYESRAPNRLPYDSDRSRSKKIGYGAHARHSG